MFRYKNFSTPPIILSASRETDVSVFYADWFVERLKDGWCGWLNPFNQQRYRVNFGKARCTVFWSKNPMPMLDRLDEVEARVSGSITFSSR